jgi:hypothetical protein
MDNRRRERQKRPGKTGVDPRWLPYENHVEGCWLSRMSKEPCVYRPKHFAGRLLVWLAAVLVPLQSLPAAACCCASASQQGSGAEQRQGPSDLCCLTARSCCDGTRADSHSCCKTTHQVPSKCSCRTSGVCSCPPHNSSSDPQAPPEGGRQVVHIAAQPLAAVSWCLDDSRVSTSPSYGAWSSACSGFERCIVLCRFTL